MLVIANQRAGSIRRQGRLAGAGEAEENADIALFPDIGRAMHRQHVAVGQDIVEIAEDRFLDLARILRAGDQNHPFLKVHHDRAIGVHSVAFRMRLEVRCVQDREFRHEVGPFFGGRLAEHVTREKTVPRAFADHSDLELIGRIRTGDEVLYVDFPALEIGQHLQPQPIEALFRIRLVDGTPPDIVAGRLFLDDEFIVR